MFLHGSPWDVGYVAWGSGSRMRGGRDQLGQAINCLMFAFLSLPVE